MAPTRGGETVAPPAALNLTAQQLFDRDMKPINFDYDKSDIRDDQKGKLQTASAYMKANSSVRITIEGNADERGSEEYNLALGDRRANAVKQYLVSQGIAENRLSSVSYGEERPVCKAQRRNATNRTGAPRFGLTRNTQPEQGGYDENTRYDLYCQPHGHAGGRRFCIR